MAILTELVKQLELAKVIPRKETPLIWWIDKTTFTIEKRKICKIKGLVLVVY
jgi:hypothetical protein